MTEDPVLQPDVMLHPTDIERIARQNGMTIAEICRRSGVSQSTFARWKQGINEPTLRTYRLLRNAAAGLYPALPGKKWRAPGKPRLAAGTRQRYAAEAARTPEPEPEQSTPAVAQLAPTRGTRAA